MDDSGAMMSAIICFPQGAFFLNGSTRLRASGLPVILLVSSVVVSEKHTCLYEVRM